MVRLPRTGSASASLRERTPAKEEMIKAGLVAVNKRETTLHQLVADLGLKPLSADEEPSPKMPARSLASPNRFPAGISAANRDRFDGRLRRFEVLRPPDAPPVVTDPEAPALRPQRHVPTQLRPSIAQWWSQFQGCCRAPMPRPQIADLGLLFASK